MPHLAFDTPTVLLLQGALGLLLPLVAWSILLGRHEPVATALWCGGGALGGIAMMLISVRPALPAWLGLTGTATLASLAYVLRVAALRRERALPAPRAAMVTYLVVATLAYDLSQDSSTWREGAGMVVRCIGAGWLACAAWALVRGERSRSAALIATVSALAAAAFGWRALELAFEAGRGPVTTAATYLPIFLTGMLSTLFINVGYVGLAWERARAAERAQALELEQEHARLVRAEAHVRELDAARAERRAAINEAVPAMMHSIDARGALVAVSDTWLDKLGYTRDEVIGRASVEFLTEDSREYARATVLPGFFRTGRCDNVPYRMRCKDGKVIEVQLSAVLERDAQGQPLRSLAVIEDQSDLKARQADLEREQAQRLQAEDHARKLDALLAERSEMLRVLAHEVRQPLNNASAALQDAQRELAREDQAVAARPLLQARGVLTEVLTGLDNTLAVAALLAAGQARPADTDIDMLLDIARGDAPPAARPRLRVDRVAPTRTAAMDLSLVRLALRNLLANALAYAPPDTPVTLRVLDGDDPLALILEVESAGPPIAADLAPRLFDRGTRGQALPDKPGSGLGLYIVRRVMELHHGQALLARNEAGAVVFRLVIPQALDG